MFTMRFETSFSKNFISKIVGGVLLEGCPKRLFSLDILSPFRKKIGFPYHAFSTLFQLVGTRKHARSRKLKMHD